MSVFGITKTKQATSDCCKENEVHRKCFKVTFILLFELDIHLLFQLFHKKLKIYFCVTVISTLSAFSPAFSPAFFPAFFPTMALIGQQLAFITIRQFPSQSKKKSLLEDFLPRINPPINPKDFIKFLSNCLYEDSIEYPIHDMLQLFFQLETTPSVSLTDFLEITSDVVQPYHKMSILEFGLEKKKINQPLTWDNVYQVFKTFQSDYSCVLKTLALVIPYAKGKPTHQVAYKMIEYYDYDSLKINILDLIIPVVPKLDLVAYETYFSFFREEDYKERILPILMGHIETEESKDMKQDKKEDSPTPAVHDLPTLTSDTKPLDKPIQQKHESVSDSPPSYEKATGTLLKN